MAVPGKAEIFTNTWLFTLVVLLTCCPISTNSELVPTLLEEPVSTVVNRGQSVELRCQVSPSSAVVHWLHEGEIIATNPNLGYLTKGTSLHVTAFKDSRHKGLYYCIAETSVGSIRSHPALLSSPSLGEFSVLPDKYLSVTVGNTAVLPCTPPKSHPAANITFMVNSTVIVGDERHQILPSGNMHISGVTGSDSGVYSCIATNPIDGRNRTAVYRLQLTVQEVASPVPVSFLPVSQTNVTAIAGSDVVFECAAQGHPPPQIVWKRYGMNLNLNTSHVHLGNLRIRNVDARDEGTYICSIKDQSVAKIYTLNVQVLPVVHIPHPNMVKHVGQTVRIECQVKPQHRGDKPAVEWLHNSQQLQPKRTNATVVTISNVELSDSGLYQCVAISKTGIVSAVARLQVKPAIDDAMSHKTTAKHSKKKDKQKSSRGRGNRKRRKKNKRRRNKKGRKTGKKEASHVREGKVKLVPPSRPEVSKVDETSVFVNWTVPENDGLAITFFRVQYKELKPSKGSWNTVEEDISKRKRKYHVRNLIPGYTYKFRITAVYTNNDNRFGPNSKRFSLAKGSLLPPDTPVIVEVKPLEVENVYTLNVRWRYMSGKSVPVEGFHLEYSVYQETLSDKDYTRITLVHPNARSYFIKNLQPATQYKVRIKCFNQAGESDYSVPAVKKTPGKDPKESLFVPPLPPMTGRPTMRTTVRMTVGLTSNTSAAGVLTVTETETDEPGETGEVSRPRNSTQSSSQMLYMVLGIVLGVMMLALIIFMVLCGIKQRQQRRMMDTMGKKYMNGGFALNGINGTVPNGQATHYHNGQNKMNISVNPMTEVTTMQQMGDNSSMQQPGMPASPAASDNNFNSLSSSNKNVTQNLSTFGYSGSPGESGEDQRSVSGSQGSQSSTSSLPDYRHCLATMQPTQLTPGPHCCSCAHSSNHRPTSAHSRHSHHRRRRKHRSSGQEHATRDQATNTDLSSNDGTMDSSSVPELCVESPALVEGGAEGEGEGDTESLPETPLLPQPPAYTDAVQARSDSSDTELAALDTSEPRVRTHSDCSSPRQSCAVDT